MPEQEFKLLPSKLYLLLLANILIASILVFLCLPISLLLKFAGFILLLIYGFYLYWNNILLKGPQAITAIRYAGENKWLVCRQGEIIEVTLEGDSTVTGLMSILRFRVPDRFRPWSCVIFRDALLPDQYRQLLVLLRMGG